jgi:hypothetical protein
MGANDGAEASAATAPLRSSNEMRMLAGPAVRISAPKMDFSGLNGNTVSSRRFTIRWVRKRGSRAMARFSELLQELARAERDVARFARQAEFVRELDADGHDTTFGAKRLLVMLANLNQMERRRQQIVRKLSVYQRELAA